MTTHGTFPIDSVPAPSKFDPLPRPPAPPFPPFVAVRPARGRPRIARPRQGRYPASAPTLRRSGRNTRTRTTRTPTRGGRRDTQVLHVRCGTRRK